MPERIAEVLAGRVEVVDVKLILPADVQRAAGLDGALFAGEPTRRADDDGEHRHDADDRRQPTNWVLHDWCLPPSPAPDGTGIRK